MDANVRHDERGEHLGANHARLIVLSAESKRKSGYWRVRELIWSWSRVAAFVGLLLTYLIASGLTPPVVAGMAFWVGLFLFGLRRHAVSRRNHLMAEQECLVLSEALQRIGGQLVVVRSSDRAPPAQEPDCGLPPAIEDGRTWSLTDQERDDLDLYASPVGLFGLLNRASTPLGARRLDVMLNQPCLCPARIEARQAGVRWLESHSEQRIRLMAAAAGLRPHADRLDALVSAVHSIEPIQYDLPAGLLRAWGFISGSIIVYVVVRLIQGHGGGGWLGLLMVNGLILLRTHPRLTKVLSRWQYMADAVGNWLAAARAGGDALPGENELVVLRDRFARAAGHTVLARLHRQLQWLNVGGLVQVLLNFLLLYDLQVGDAIVRHVLRHREVLADSLSALAELDALAGLACFAYEQPLICYPEITSDPRLEIVGGVHPLLPPEEAAPNDLQLAGPTRTWLITGSNMAGKSTFLRMTAVNVLLAQMGTGAAARQMRLSPVRLLTDLRARDNLARNESYYLAEVRQLRRMVCPPADTLPILGLIDEPFRGTNSEEQAAASVAVVEHLIQSGQFFVIATHEPRLTHLADGSTARNFHFRELLDAGGMVFDYVLRPGAAQTRNAIRILQREAYPDNLVQRAERALQDGQQVPSASEG